MSLACSRLIKCRERRIVTVVYWRVQIDLESLAQKNPPSPCVLIKSEQTVGTFRN